MSTYTNVDIACKFSLLSSYAGIIQQVQRVMNITVQISAGLKPAPQFNYAC